MSKSNLDFQKFEKLIMWELSQNLSFGAGAIFAVLCFEAGKVIDIDLSQVWVEYTTEILETAKKIYPSTYRDAEINQNTDAKSRKILSKGLKQLQRLGFLKVLASQNWKHHTVEIYPVWEH